VLNEHGLLQATRLGRELGAALAASLVINA
jgi:hypothetical protein